MTRAWPMGKRLRETNESDRRPRQIAGRLIMLASAGVAGGLFLFAALQPDPAPPSALALTPAIPAGDYELIIDGVPAPQSAEALRSQIQALKAARRITPPPPAVAVTSAKANDGADRLLGAILAQAPQPAAEDWPIEATAPASQSASLMLMRHGDLAAAHADWPVSTTELAPATRPVALPTPTPSEAPVMADLPFAAPSLPRLTPSPVVAVAAPSATLEPTAAKPTSEALLQKPGSEIKPPARPGRRVSLIKPKPTDPSTVLLSPKRPRPINRRPPRPEPPIVPAWANRID